MDEWMTKPGLTQTHGGRYVFHVVPLERKSALLLCLNLKTLYVRSVTPTQSGRLP